MGIRYRDRLRFGRLLAGVALFIFMPALAAMPLHVAVPDGVSPGIYKVVDLNDDQDALDAGEVTLFAAGTFTDLGIDGEGVIYAIKTGSAKVYRIEDKDADGDALGIDEVEVFRDDRPAGAEGILLKRPLSIAVTTFFDPFSGKNRVLVYTMDVVIQQAILLEDRDGDGSANQASDIMVVDSFETPFTPQHMMVDKAGRILAGNANRLSLVRFDDANGDASIGGIRDECPRISGGCGPGLTTDFQVIRSYQTGQDRNLRGPVGVTVLSSEEWLVSDSSGYVYKLTDLDRDEDAQSATEIGYYAEVGRQYDLVADEHDVTYLGVPNSPGNILRLEDKNGDGRILSGEIGPYATVPGSPMSLDLQPSLDTRALSIEAHSGVDLSPMKGPVLVVEDGQTTTMKLRVVDDDGNPVEFQRMAHIVLSGCFSVCPVPTNETDPDGVVAYEVKRTQTKDHPESLKFWVQDRSGGRLGQNKNVLLLPVISTPCTPDPIADPGPDQTVPAGSNVILDGTGSVGEGLRYCWTQTSGPDLGLEECGGEVEKLSFTAPQSPAILTFDLQVRNGCDIFSDPAETRVIVPAPCDADGDGDIDLRDALTVWKFLLQGIPPAGDGDCNEDGIVNYKDLLAILRKARP